MDEEAFSRSQTTISVGERGAKSQRRGRFVSEAVMAASALLMLLLLLIVAALTWALVRAMPADTEGKRLLSGLRGNYIIRREGLGGDWLPSASQCFIVFSSTH